MNSDTPRTEAHIKELQRNPEVSGCDTTLEFARQLERENTRLHQAIAMLREAVSLSTHYVDEVLWNRALDLLRPVNTLSKTEWLDEAYRLLCESVGKPENDVAERNLRMWAELIYGSCEESAGDGRFFVKTSPEEAVREEIESLLS